MPNQYQETSRFQATSQFQATNQALRPHYAKRTFLNKGPWYLIAANLCAALGYYLLAQIGFAEGSLGINASLLWPPSGFCVFLIYKFGKTLLPGMWLGAVLSSISLNVIELFNPERDKVIIGLFNGSAAILQAYAIATVSTWFHRHTRPQLGRQVVLFIGITLLLGSISAGLSNLCFAAFGKLSNKEWIGNAGLWWMGDVIGILVMVPFLTWFDAYFNRKQNAFANAYFIGAIGTGVVLLIFTALGHHQHLNQQQENERRQSDLITALKTNLAWAQRDAGILQDYFTNNAVTRESFSDIAQPLLMRNPILEQMAILPVDHTVLNQNILNFKQGSSLIKTTDGEFVWLAPDESFFPSADIETLVKLLTSVQTRTFWEASASGKKIPFISALFPISFCSAQNAKQCDLFNVISVKINVDRLLTKVTEDIGSIRTPFSLIIQTPNSQLSHLHWTGSAWEDATGLPLAKDILSELPQFELNHARWLIDIQFNNDNRFAPSFSQLLVIIIGLSLTAVLTAYLNMLRTHDLLLQNNQRQLETEIAQQTQKLRETNTSLTDQIHERQKAQDQLKRSETQLRTLLDNIPDPVWLKSTKGEYLGFNKKVEQMFFRKEEDVIGKTAADYSDAEFNQTIVEFENEVLNSKQAVRRQLWMQIPQYNEKRLMDIIKIAVIDEQDNSTAILSIARDITDQYYAEQALQEAKNSAEEATQAKSRFLANMSHEIRTPMNAVLGYAQLLMTDPELSSLQRERLEAILKAGQRLLNLINDILDLSKIEAGALLVREEFFDLTQEVSDITLLMRERASAKGLEFITDVQMPEVTIVKSDRHKIGQVLLNLLGNAIKFTAEGYVSFTVKLTNKGIAFTIKDSGPGIAEKELHQLFSAFKQGKAGQDTGGTGLGLVISKHIVEHLGGTLDLTSEALKGTQAHLYLPLLPEQSNIDLPRHAPLNVNDVELASSETCKALVVEDDSASRELLVELLHQIGCEVDASANGQEGLQKALSQDYAIVFTDIRMPELDGMEMLKRIRQTKTEQELPVVAVSASNLDHERNYYLLHGFQEFIGKPYKFNDIFKALNDLSGARFVINTTQDNTEKTVTADWSDISNAQVLQQQLQALVEYLQNGDIQSAKKILTQLSDVDLGSQPLAQIQQALRQYDAPLAAQLVEKSLTQLTQHLAEV